MPSNITNPVVGSDFAPQALASGDKDSIILEVSDSGIGIAEEEQESVFKVFHRATNNRRLDGSGLGLSISQQLAELHGGRVELTSQLGEGSTFRLALPVTPLSKSTVEPTAQILRQEATSVGGNTAP